jgi:replicative DNA helicase
MGKTALALGMACNAAIESHRPVLLFSLEMGQLELTQRLLCAEARVDSRKVRTGQLTESDWGKIAHATGRLADAPIWIDDNPNVTIMEIRAKARRLRSRRPWPDRGRLPAAHERSFECRKPSGGNLGNLSRSQDSGS